MLDGLPDAELLRRSGEDPEAFGIFYDRHFHVVLGYFYRWTGSPETAADLTAETFASAFESRRRYRNQGAPARAWVLGIARRHLYRFLRRGRVASRARQRLGLERMTLDDESLDRIEELADLEAVREALRDALEQLSPKLADAVLLRIGAELPYEEVARRLGCSVGAARVRVARGLRKLSDQLGGS